MKKFYFLLVLCIITLFSNGQAGIFGSAVAIIKNANPFEFLNTNPLAGDQNAIGTSNFGGSLGTYHANSGTLILAGGEIKTFKGSNSNICGGTIKYRVYPDGNPSGDFTAIDLPYFSGCNLSQSTFEDGKGPCGTGDQKWQKINANIDLTNRSPGIYILEVYYQGNGSTQSSSACNETFFDSNNSANYYATFTIDAPLPVKWLSFDGTRNGNSNLLRWVTSSEWNVARFVVESSTNGVHFEAAGSINNSGDRFNTARYEFAHQSSHETTYYRILTMDENGNRSYSKVIVLRNIAAGKVSIFPNPTQQYVTVSGADAGTEIRLLDLSGRLLSTATHTGNTRMDLGRFSKGLYVIRFTSQGTTKTQTIQKN